MQAMILNFLAFQAGWFACVLGGASGWPWLGVGVVAAVIALHVFQSPEASRELRLVAAAAVIGTAWDSTLAATGILIYPSGQLASMLAPVWIVALWMGFATCLNVSLRWLKGRPGLAMLLGGVAGPMSFWAGSRLGAVTFADPLWSLAILSAGWALLMPLLLRVADRCDGWAETLPGRGNSPPD